MTSILVMGLPTSGKTTFARQLLQSLQPNACHHNADAIRQEANDWDFSFEGRKRQAYRMYALKMLDMQHGRHSILDFVCPCYDFQEIVSPDLLVWMDTVQASPYADTNAIFQPPLWWNVRITRFEDVIGGIQKLVGGISKNCVLQELP